ncbi:hypothetical protein GCM10008955_42150 [Deinococcus malanensis]|uniref:PhnA-like protein n=1 Tax=Deinococcus malanensis TaxID=1706855 RepID=A0ABQ2F2E9_9DEIO|nr:hypothetical protein [Deinococcus malanensis]GGK43963.1 hypothetical protein GCM10008955_42150 [Deinococcus malanensis]
MTLVDHGNFLTRINWTGVLAGVVVGVVTQLALSALGVTFGAGADTARGLAIGTVIWLGLSLLISAFLAGLTAARASGYLTPAQGRFNGLITGSLLALLTTLVLSNALTAGFRTASNILGSAANVAGQAGGAAANSTAGQSDPVQNVLNGLDEQEIGQIIGESAPELSEEQATAATRVVSGIVRRASRDLGRNLNNVSSLDEFVTNRLDSITTALSGEQFVTRLQRQGLSAAEAQTTAQAISKRATEVRQQAEEAAAATERIARTTASTAAWGFLLALGLILGAATLGGGKGADLPSGGSVVTGRDAQSRI